MTDRNIRQAFNLAQFMSVAELRQILEDVRGEYHRRMELPRVSKQVRDLSSRIILRAIRIATK